MLFFQGLKNKRFQRLWKRNTLTRSFPETDSDAALPSWTVPGLRYGKGKIQKGFNLHFHPLCRTFFEDEKTIGQFF